MREDRRLRRPRRHSTEAVKFSNRGQIASSFNLDTPIVNDSADPRGHLLEGGRVTRIDGPGAVATAGAALPPGDAQYLWTGAQAARIGVQVLRRAQHLAEELVAS